MNTHEKWNISAVKKICVDKQIKIIDLFEEFLKLTANQNLKKNESDLSRLYWKFKKKINR